MQSHFSFTFKVLNDIILQVCLLSGLKFLLFVLYFIELLMGRLFVCHPGGTRIFSCAKCDTPLTNRSELLSVRFTGATGRAYLFNRVQNLDFSEVQERTMLTGARTTTKIRIALFYCSSCTLIRTLLVLLLALILAGNHLVRDVACRVCETKLGWMYEFAVEESQRYKVFLRSKSFVHSSSS